MKISDLLIFENDDFVALNKPSGLLSIPDRKGKEKSLKKILQETYGEIFTVHRLDKDTSGLIVFAKNELAHKFLSQQFENREAEKIYLGFITGSPIHNKATITASVMEHPGKKGMMVVNRKGKESITEYEVLENFGVCSLVHFNILTGRTHQIRVHMQDAGHPVLCDELYGDGNPFLLSSIKRKFKLSKKEEAEKPLMNRLALHASQLKLIDTNGKMKELKAPLPKDMAATLNQLRKWKAKK